MIFTILNKDSLPIYGRNQKYDKKYWTITKPFRPSIILRAKKDIKDKLPELKELIRNQQDVPSYIEILINELSEKLEKGTDTMFINIKYNELLKYVNSIKQNNDINDAVDAFNRVN